MDGTQVYVVTNTESKFVGVYSTVEKANNIIRLLGGTYEGHDLVVSYERIDENLAR